jgi:hypothetical protein
MGVAIVLKSQAWRIEGSSSVIRGEHFLHSPLDKSLYKTDCAVAMDLHAQMQFLHACA